MKKTIIAIFCRGNDSYVHLGLYLLVELSLLALLGLHLLVGAKVPGSESSKDRKVPGSESSKERKFQGANGLGSEKSIIPFKCFPYYLF